MTRAAAWLLAAVAILPSSVPNGSVSHASDRATADLDLSSASVADAMRLGRGTPTEREQFHQKYRQPLVGSLSGDLEVVTPYRRVVLMTEEHVRMADVAWTPERAATALEPLRGRLTIGLHLRFDPRNAYQALPAVSVALLPRGSAGSAILPVDTRSAAVYVSGQPAPPGTPVLGARIESTFSTSRLDPAGVYLVSIAIEGREAERVPVDLGRLR